MKITIPDFCLVVVIAAPGSEPSAFVRSQFEPSEVVSVEDSLLAGGVLPENIEMFLDTRLQRRCLTVVEARNALRRDERAMLIHIAKSHYAQTVAIVLAPEDDDQALEQVQLFQRSLPQISKESFLDVHVLRSREEISTACVERVPTRTDNRGEHGPFDIIGDVHGCVNELIGLMSKLGYTIEITGSGRDRRVVSRTPPGRRAIFVGDLVDRGPASPDVLRIVMHMVAQGQALAVPGNHDVKLLRWLNGRNVKQGHGIAQTISQLEAEPDEFRDEVRDFIDGLVSHLWLEDGRLTVAHAGIKEEMMGRVSGAVREFCLYGETSGETDEFGLPIRYHWAAEYRGETTIVYGHTPVPEADWLNNTLCVDTGCVFGGQLTALRWPEREIVSIPAAKAYATPIRPFAHPPLRPGYSPEA